VPSLPPELQLDLELTPEHEAFRARLCAFLRTTLTADVRARHTDLAEQGGWSVEYRRRFKRALGEQGFIGTGWPEHYGGGGKDMLYEVLFVEELEYHGAPGIGEPSLTYVPHALLAFATEEQKRRFLPPLRRGELNVFLGYSEPEAGSDLAALSTRAVRDGEDFVITGQKAYSSYAHFADYGFVAARTDASGGRHEGISLFLVDMKASGVTLSHHITVSGASHPSVHFESVRVPADMLVGELDQGWRLLMSAIDYERAALSAPGMADHQLDRLLNELPRLDDPVVADRAITLAIEAEAARLYAYAVAHAHARGERPQHETSLSVLLKREAVRMLETAALEETGHLAPLGPGSPGAPLDGAAEHEYREHLFYSFAAGGFDITRNVIAARGLGLGR
jgi:alkylation response protein AidB-like acyl-CoA dehydrogenase